MPTYSVPAPIPPQGTLGPDEAVGGRPAPPHPGTLIPRAEVQRYFPFLSKPYLTRLAHEGRGPTYHRIAGRAFYTVADIKAFIASCRVVPNERCIRAAPPTPTAPALATAPPPLRKRGRPRKTRSRPRPAPVGAPLT